MLGCQLDLFKDIFDYSPNSSDIKKSKKNSYLGDISILFTMTNLLNQTKGHQFL